MIRRSTVVYIVILLIVAGAYFYLKFRKEPVADVSLTPEATEQVIYLFTAEQGIPTSIQIQSNTGQSVEVARDAESVWVLSQPTEAKAEQGAAEAAATQVSTMRILDKVTNVDPKIIGLDNPEYVLTVKFNSKVERTVNIGVVTPSESGYYVQDASGGDVVIVSKSAIDALLMLLTNPPYLETLTPGPVVTDTLLPGTPTTLTPNQTVTVTPPP
jgi:hypothetical protein